MKHTAFDLDQDSTIVSVLAIREPRQSGLTAGQVLGLAILTATSACVLVWYLGGAIGW